MAEATANASEAAKFFADMLSVGSEQVDPADFNPGYDGTWGACVYVPPHLVERFVAEVQKRHVLAIQKEREVLTSVLGDDKPDVALLGEVAESSKATWKRMPKYTGVSRVPVKKMEDYFDMPRGYGTYYGLKDGVAASEALDALIASGDVGDCYCANNIYRYAALRDQIGAEKFNALFSTQGERGALMGNMRIGASRDSRYLPQIQAFAYRVHYKDVSDATEITSSDAQVVVGDSVYFLNHKSYPMVCFAGDSHFQGTHMIVTRAEPLELCGFDFSELQKPDDFVSVLHGKLRGMVSVSDVPGYMPREHIRMDTAMVEAIQQTDIDKLPDLVKNKAFNTDITTVKENPYHGTQQKQQPRAHEHAVNVANTKKPLRHSSVGDLALREPDSGKYTPKSGAEKKHARSRVRDADTETRGR